MTTIKKGNIDIIYKSKDNINLANDVPFYKGRKFISGNDKSTCTVYELGPISPTSNSETNRHISYIEAVVKNNADNTNGEVNKYGFYIYISEKASEEILRSITESATLSSPYKLSNNCVFLLDYGITGVDNTKIGTYNSSNSKSYNYRSRFYQIRNINDNEYDILSIVINPGYVPNQQVDNSDSSTTVQFYMNKVLSPMLSDLNTNKLDPYWSTQYIKDPYIYIILFPITTNEDSISPSSLQILQFNTTYDRYIYKDLAFMCGSQEWESSKLPEVSEPAYFPIDYPGNVCTINQNDMIINYATYDNLIGPEIFMQSCVVTDLYDKLFSAEIEYKLTSDAGKLCVLFGSFKEDNSAIDWFRENTEFSSNGAYRTYYNPNKVNFGIYGNTFSFEEVFDTYAIFSISFDSWTSGQRTFTEYIEIKPINGDKAVARNNTQQQAGTGEVYKLYFKFYKGIPESSYPGFGFKVYYELTDSTRHELGNLYLFQQAAGTNGVQGVFSNPRTFICAYPGTNDSNERLTLDHINRMKVNWGTRPYVLPKLYGSVFEQSVPSVSSTNTKWKSMFYYNRRYTFTGKNDNLVILPYNLMETREDSIFLEAVFPPTGNYNVMYWVIIGSNIGYDFDPTSIETTTQMVTNLQDGVIVAVDSSKTSANLYEMQFVSGNKIVNAGGLTIDDGGQQDGITACLFRDGTDTSSTASLIIRAKHDADSTQKMEGNEWDKLKTIVIQAQYLGESSTVTDSTDLGWVELNFGPTAKHPANQELIDQLLDNDSGGGVQQPQIIDEVTVDDQTLISYKNSSDYDDDYLTEPASAVYKQINNIYDDDHYKWEGEVE